MNKIQNELEYIKVRNSVYRELENIVSEKEYIKVEPDYFESYDDIIKTNSRITPKSMVKIIAPNGEILLLRPDITTNIIKQLSPYWEKDSVFKMFYNATTFRRSDKEIIQAKQFGIEYIGESSMSSDIEIIKLALTIFNTFKDDFILSIGNQKLLDSLFDTYSRIERNDIYKAIIRKDSTSYTQIIRDNEDELTKSLLELNGTIEEVLDMLNNMKSSVYTNDFIRFLELLKGEFKNEELDRIMIDLALLTEFDYYCGIVLQGYVKNLSKPILSGGRYDKLTKQYGTEIPAVGISFDVGAYIKEVNNG